MFASFCAGSGHMPAITVAKFASRYANAVASGADAVRRAVDRVDVHRGVHDGHLGPVLHVRGDRLVRELLHEARLPVVLEARAAPAPSNALFSAGYGIGPDELRDDRRHVVERLERRLALLERARPSRPTIAMNVSPWRSSGMNGSGGAIWNAGNAPISSGASAMYSR